MISLSNIFGIILFIAITIFFGWLTFRAWRARNAILKWGGTLLAGLLALVFALVTVVLAIGMFKMYMPRSVQVAEVTIERSPAQVARGEHIAASLCASCHSTNNQLPLSGGKNLSADTGLPLGDIYPPNITPGGKLQDLSDTDLWRLFRGGVLPNGRVAAGMPLVHLRNLSDDDVKAIIAYLRTQPAVQNDIPPTNPSLLTAALVGTGVLKIGIPPVTGPVVAPTKGPTVEYGKYIVSYNDCTDCHGEKLDGNAKPPAPHAPTLAHVRFWTTQQFINTLRTGTDPSGHQLQPPMAWQSYGKLDDDELTALHEYLKSFPFQE